MSLNKRSLPVDVSVGSKIRSRRLLKGWSQTDLALRLGITFQQVQKYEKGANRVAASRLHTIAEVLEMPIADLFPTSNSHQNFAGPVAIPLADPLLVFISTREGIKLNRAFASVSDPRIRRRLIELIRTLGSDDALD
jgi:transcriptional regulator with XRE-family HTH domain